MALTGALRWFPMLFFGVFVGVISDRIDRRTLVLIDQGASIAITCLVGVLLFAGWLAPAYIFIASFLMGIFSANDMPARRGLLADLVGEERLVGALTLDVVSLNIAVIVAGVLAGVMLATIGPVGAYAVMIPLYVAGFAAQYASHARSSPQPGRAQSPLANLKEGAAYAATSPVIVATLAVTVGMNLLVFPYKVLLPVFARDVLGVGPEGLGVLAAADGVGALLGALALASRARGVPKGPVYLGGSLIMAVAMILFGQSQMYPLSVVLLVLLGTGLAGFQTMQAGIVLSATPPELRGRMIGILSVAIGCYPLGMLLLGGAASLIDPLVAVTITGLLQALLVAVTAFLVPSLRRF